MPGLLTLHLHLPACASLKEKCGRPKPLQARLQRQFNVSTAEIGLLDKWTEAVISCGMVGNNAEHLGSALETVRNVGYILQDLTGSFWNSMTQYNHYRFGKPWSKKKKRIRKRVFGSILISCLLAG
jgi:uncharacterized protein YlxP (DUF503 family)